MKKTIKMLLYFLLITVLIAASYFVYQDHESITLTDEVRSSLTGSFIKTPQGTVHYQLIGPENADLVVLVHGFSVPSYLWQPTVEFLVQQGYRVLRYDLFGHGLSDRPDEGYGLDMLSDQLFDLLNLLKVNRPIQLLGLSMGGPLVARFTSRYPEKVNALIFQDPMVSQIAAERIWPLNIPLLGEYITTVYLVPSYIREHKNEPSKNIYFSRWGDQFKQQVQYKGYRNAVLSLLRYMTKHPFINEYQKLSEIKVPKLLIWGSKDATIPISEADKLLALMPDIQFEVIQNAGHVPSMELPEKFNSILLKFLHANPWKPKDDL